MADSIKVHILADLIGQVLVKILKREDKSSSNDNSLPRLIFDFSLRMDELSRSVDGRHSYVSKRQYLSATFHPNPVDEAIWSPLREEVRNVLGPYIHNDRFLCMNVGGSPDEGLDLNYMLAHLLAIALERGALHAARSLYDSASRISVPVHTVVLVDGLQMEQDPVEISPGIRLAHISNSEEGLAIMSRVVPSIGGHHDYVGRSLIVIDQLVSPVFVRPYDASSRANGYPFTISNVNTEYPNFSYDDFCEALSLSINHSVRPVAMWRYMDLNEAYAVPAYMPPTFLGLNFRRPHWLLKHDNPPVISEEDVRKAASIYEARSNLSAAVANKLRVPIDRWMKSKEDEDPVDSFINIGTALESIYLSDSKYTGETTYRLALRAAWHLGGRDVEERNSLFAKFKKVYKARSDAVHRGKLNHGDHVTLRTMAEDLCLKAITEIIVGGKFPNWDRLTLGDT